MAQVIIKNTDSKVIRNVAGNVLRQNFQFGKAMSKGVVSAYLKITKVITNTNDPFTFLVWTKMSAATEGQMALVDSTNYGRIESHFISGSVDTSSHNPYTNTTQTINSNIPMAPIGGGVANLFGWINIGPSQTHVTGYLNGSKANTAAAFPLGSNPFQFLLVGWAIRPGSGQQLNTKFDEILCFNRVISDAELAYIYNQRRGNEPSSLEGLKGWFRCEVAEELDFSVAQDGSDLRPALRDLSGNLNHAEFINVPAGTNAQKVDYVNNNLLIVW